jgi:AhpD family alkylhydroperoxidase
MARMKNPAVLLPDAMKALQALAGAVNKGPAGAKTLALVHLRTSQINGCSFCVDGGAKHMKQAGETDERIIAVSAWRDTAYFNEAERAALALAEAVTRMSDRSDPVPDEVWAEAARHYDEPSLANLVLAIATTNVWNRLNVATKQLPGSAKW